MRDDNQDRRNIDAEIMAMVNELRSEFEHHTGRERDLIDQLKSTVYALSSGASPEVQHKRNQYLDFLIEREKTRAAFRSAVIEKTTASLVWAMLVGLGYAVLHYLFPGRW